MTISKYCIQNGKKPQFCFIIYDFIPFLGPEDDGGAQELEFGKYETRVSIFIFKTENYEIN